MVQSVKRLPLKCGDLNLDPLNSHEKMCMVICACNPQMGKTGGKKQEFQANELSDPVSNKRWKVPAGFSVMSPIVWHLTAWSPVGGTI